MGGDADVGREPGTPGTPSTPTRLVDLTDKQRKYLLSRYTLEDRIFFTAGVLNVVMAAFIVGRWPQSFWLHYLAEASILIPWRFIRFRRRNYEWYLTDFCYFVTYAFAASCAVASVRVATGYKSPLFYYRREILRALFACATGPLAVSVVLFTNSLVFHDIDQTTSVFIHLSPAVLAYCIRWGAGLGPATVEKAYPGYFSICPANHDLAGVLECIHEGAWWCDSCPGAFREFVVYPIVVWALWAIPYYLVVLCGLKGYLERNGKETLFVHMMKKNGPLSSFVRLFPEVLHHKVYMVVHAVSMVVFGAFSYVLWHSFIVHSIFIVLITLIAVKNGASYYFKIIVTRYLDTLLREHGKDARKVD